MKHKLSRTAIATLILNVVVFGFFMLVVSKESSSFAAKAMGVHDLRTFVNKLVPYLYLITTLPSLVFLYQYFIQTKGIQSKTDSLDEFDELEQPPFYIHAIWKILHLPQTALHLLTAVGIFSVSLEGESILLLIIPTAFAGLGTLSIVLLIKSIQLDKIGSFSRTQ